MTLNEKLAADLKSAIFAKEALLVETIRFLRAEVKN